MFDVIAVPVDGSDYGYEAADVAIEIAQKFNSKIAAVHVLEEFSFNSYDSEEDAGDAILAKITENFVGYFADEKTTAQTIRACWEKYNYLSDTHTAVAISAAEQYITESGDTLPMVIDSTASPYKFANNVYKAVTGKLPTDDLSALDDLSTATATEIPYPLAGLATRKVRFDKVVKREEMATAVLDYLGL